MATWTTHHRMANGAYDYNTLVRRMVSQMTAPGSGPSHPFSDGGSDYGVDYASGWAQSRGRGRPPCSAHWLRPASPVTSRI